MKIDEGNIDDYLYEQWRDDEAEKEYEELKKVNMETCCHCGGEFEEWDLDRCDEGWICRECEEKLK